MKLYLYSQMRKNLDESNKNVFDLTLTLTAFQLAFIFERGTQGFIKQPNENVA